MDPAIFAFLIILFGVPPAFFYLWFFYKRDKWEREPFKLILTIFLFGFIATEIAGVLNDQIGPLIGLAISAGIVEESLKWGVVFFGAYPRKEFNEPLDGLVYGAAAGLGFAVFENVEYMWRTLLLSGFDTAALIGNALVRGVLAVPGHALFTGTSCFFLGVAKFMPKGQRRYAVALGGLVLAMAMHSAYDTLAFGLHGLLVIFALIIFSVVAWLLMSYWTNIGLNRSPFNPTRWTPLPSAVLGAHIGKAVSSAGVARSSPRRFCPRCGAPLAGVARFCPKCGTQISAEAGSPTGDA